MPRHAATFRVSRSARRLGRRRRGSGTLIALLVTTGSLLFFAALAIDFGWLVVARMEMQAVADSASRAGAAELWDRDLLVQEGYTNLAEIGLPGAMNNESVEERQLQSARDEASAFAGQNKVTNDAASLTVDDSNDPNGDLVFGFVSESMDPDEPLAPGDGPGEFNSLLVRMRRTAGRGNPLTLLVGSFLKLDAVDATVTSRATLDQRVYGFRPFLHLTARVMPVVVDPNEWKDQASAAAGAANDTYDVDFLTGEFDDATGDGIPEVRLTIRVSSGADVGDTRLLKFVTSGAGSLSGPTLQGQIQTGLTAADLEDLDFELALSPNTLDLVQPAPPNNSVLSAVHTGTQSLYAQDIGQIRVFPLGMDVGSSRRIVDFAVGRVVGSQYDSGNSRLEIVVQPSLLQEPTALVRTGMPRNPWLGKLVLTH